MGLACWCSQCRGTTGERHRDLGYPRTRRDEGQRQTTSRKGSKGKLDERKKETSFAANCKSRT